eukprot:TRINITY_DN17061_c0_g1_i1.p1 TRINITY_DN17061_c0_g1~~TRINITY_DN17061_c0_g1_i1.p1  ORF type:complete len:101 (-),score=28.50 TRINITY_DN17061_c0_g1_i1:64-366(-)
MSLDDEFLRAADGIRHVYASSQMIFQINKTLDTEEQQQIYALYKQATVGDVNTSRPWAIDTRGRGKWDAWSSKRGMDGDAAKTAYIQLVKILDKKHGILT